MKKQLMLALSLALASSMALADDAVKRDYHVKKGGHHQMVKEIKKELNLTEAQEQAARHAFRDTKRQHFEISKKYLDKLPEAERAAMKKELVEMYKGKRNDFMATLTPEQQLQAKALYLKHSVGLGEKSK